MKKEVRVSEASAYWVIAYYYIGKIEDPRQEVQVQKECLALLDATCRLYITKDGLNGQMCIARKDAQVYIDWMHSREQFKDVHFKLQGVDTHVFPRCTVKVRNELVALGTQVDFSKRGKYLTPNEWKNLLEDTNQENIVIDTRNEYEWKVGHFEGAELLPYETFKDFLKYARDLKSRLETEKSPKNVLMYCTGGIRCELYSALLQEQGIENVYQLKGGIINYGQEAGSSHWKGSLFVFDDRLTVPLSEEKTDVIGKCHHCGVETESYYNCANVDCNELFLSCPECLEAKAGCCCDECQAAPRLRPFAYAHTPFRRWYNYASAAESLAHSNRQGLHQADEIVGTSINSKEEIGG